MLYNPQTDTNCRYCRMLVYNNLSYITNIYIYNILLMSCIILGAAVHPGESLPTGIVNSGSSDLGIHGFIGLGCLKNPVKSSSPSLMAQASYRFGRASLSLSLGVWVKQQQVEWNTTIYPTSCPCKHRGTLNFPTNTLRFPLGCVQMVSFFLEPLLHGTSSS